MRKIGLFLIFGITSPLFGHEPLQNATNLTRGTIPNARLDPSSVTLQGNDITFTALQSTIANLTASTTTLRTDITNLTASTTTLNSRLNTVATDTTTLRTDITNLTASTTTLRTDVDGKLNAGSNNAEVVFSSMTNGFWTKIWRNEGSALTGGNVTSVDCVGTKIGCTQSGSSITITISEEAGTVSTTTHLIGLYITTSGVDTNTFVLTFREIDIMGNFYVGMATSVSMAKAGPGGLDTGAEAANTWYTLFAISNGSTHSVILSSGDVTTPAAMPSGYTKHRRVGMAYNNSSSNIVAYNRVGNLVTLGSENVLIESASPPSTPTKYDLANIVPPNAGSVYLVLQSQHGTASTYVTVRPVGYSGSLAYAFSWEISPTGATAMKQRIGFLKIPLLSTKAVLYQVSGTSIEWGHLGVGGYEEAD